MAAWDNKNLPLEYAMTSRLLSRTDKYSHLDCTSNLRGCVDISWKMAVCDVTSLCKCCNYYCDTHWIHCHAPNESKCTWAIDAAPKTINILRSCNPKPPTTVKCSESDDNHIFHLISQSIGKNMITILQPDSKYVGYG